jgi:hypothetical protein
VHEQDSLLNSKGPGCYLNLGAGALFSENHEYYMKKNGKIIQKMTLCGK